jgi:hypothetical protein
MVSPRTLAVHISLHYLRAVIFWFPARRVGHGTEPYGPPHDPELWPQSSVDGLALFHTVSKSENANIPNFAFVSFGPAIRSLRLLGLFKRDLAIALQFCSLRTSDMPARKHLLEFAVCAVDVARINSLMLDATGVKEEEYVCEGWCSALDWPLHMHTLHLQRALRSIFKALYAASPSLIYPRLAFLWICELDLRIGAAADDFFDFVDAHAALERLKIDKLVVDSQVTDETLFARILVSVARVKYALDE